MNSKSNDIEILSFEDALAELDIIVQKLETGESPLEESINAYERGIVLKNHCEKKLKEAQTKIEKISIHNDGSIKTEPFETEE